MLHDNTKEERWITWNGGACPVDRSDAVVIKRRYGPIVSDQAGNFAWSHDLYVEFGTNDIVAYRRA